MMFLDGQTFVQNLTQSETFFFSKDELHITLKRKNNLEIDEKQRLKYSFGQSKEVELKFRSN